MYIYPLRAYCTGGAAFMKQPNILFILTDQMRSTAMGCAGVEKVDTPHLDRLAGGGTRFTNAISNTPSCAPARASLFTGLHTLSHKVVNNELQVPLNTGTKGVDGEGRSWKEKAFVDSGNEGGYDLTIWGM